MNPVCVQVSFILNERRYLYKMGDFDNLVVACILRGLNYAVKVILMYL